MQTKTFTLLGRAYGIRLAKRLDVRPEKFRAPADCSLGFTGRDDGVG